MASGSTTSRRNIRAIPKRSGGSPTPTGRCGPRHSPRRLDGGCASRCQRAFRECRVLKGMHLTLMIGPAVPLPVPKSVIDALLSVQVTNGKDKSGFQLTFGVSKDSPLLRIMVPAGYFDP